MAGRRRKKGAIVERGLSVLQQVVERREDIPLDLLDTLEYEHIAVASGGDGRLVDESERAAADLAPLLEVGLGRVAREREVATRAAPPAAELEGERSRAAARSVGNEKHVLP